jgi:predicted nucleic acid-binding protein
VTALVVDASALVASLTDVGPAGAWARAVMRDAEPAAPHLVVFETANVLRRAEVARAISADMAAQAHADLVDLPISLWPYDVLASGAWGLRHNVTVYDASYVVLAHLLEVPLLTLDRRLARSPGVTCEVLAPPRS